MELTLEQALQKGVEAHKAGKAQEADKYYTAILKANPKHPDANHNMGALAVGVGKVEAALPFFKTALEVNQTIGQYWLSYINALIKLDRMDEAKSVLNQAKSNGAKGDGFDQLDTRLGLSTSKNSNVQKPSQKELDSLISLYNQKKLQQVFEETQKLTKKYTKSVILWNLMGASAAQIGQLDHAILAFQKTLSIKPDSPEAYNNMGNALKARGKLEKAIEAYKKALSIKPDLAEVFNNMGGALRDQGKLEEAIEAYKKALSIKPDNAEAYNNMGGAIKEQGKLEEAIEAYNKALSIRPDYAEAYYNMGVALKDQGKLEEAMEAYNKTLSLKPDYAEAYNNMGVAFQDQGKLEEAIEIYNKALSIKPDYAEVWNNIYFPLQAVKMKISPNENINLPYPTDIKSNSAKINLSILDYKLHRGQEREEFYFDRAITSLSTADNLTIQNREFDNESEGTLRPLSDQMVALVHFGRSGTGLIHSLIDGHPEVSTLPSIYFSQYFDHSTWLRIISDGWDGMVDRFIEIYEVLFDASSSVPVETKSKKLEHKIGIKYGMANVGDQRNEILTVNKDLFKTELKRLMACYEELDAFIFFKLVHAAYDKALKDLNSKRQIFYHIHNPDTYAQLNFQRSSPTAEWVMMVREPIQSCESWIRGSFQKKDYTGVVNRISTMLFEIDNSVYSRQRSIGVRLEDLKKKPEKTIPALCSWMGITEEDSLYEMTVQGKKWWGDPTSRDYSKDGMEAFGKTSVTRKVGTIFSEKDQFIIGTLFYPFSVRFGYIKEDEEQFNVDLKTVRPLLDEMFDFEKVLAEELRLNLEKFKESGSYLYFRSGLIKRWDTLNEYNTYPNMIKPLKIT